jgi:hypothetical protein
MFSASLTWAAQPTLIRWFLIYLALILGIALVRAARLSWHVGLKPERKTKPLESVVDAGTDPAVIAKLGLALSSSTLLRRGDPGHQPLVPNERRSVVLDTLRKADNEFLYLWNALYADIRSLRRLVQLTLLMSVLVPIYAIFPSFHDLLATGHITGLSAAVESFEAFCAHLAWGLAVSAVLLLLYGYFEGVLARRKATWLYFVRSYEEPATGDKIRAEER